MGLLQLNKGGVAKANGEGEKEKECTTECKSRQSLPSRFLIGADSESSGGLLTVSV